MNRAEEEGRRRFALRLVACCLVLVGLAMTQSPGLLVSDTKVDLALAPADFLGRALHLWDEQGAFGQVQNQAYGYLWPMGPFFLLGSALAVPGWVVQRLWVALVMSVALVGAAKLAKALGVRSDLAALAGGFAYALSPRMLTTLGPISIEAWPGALAPWVLLPLVLGSRRGSPLRAAALAGLAVAMVGGVNAAATFAVIPLGVVWLLTSEPGARRRTMMRWWPLFTLLGTLWWLVPLFLLGAYSPPFLDYIEAAANTTFPTTIFDALRGTSDWVPYVDGAWRAGNDLIRDFSLPINSGVLLILGLVGAARRDNPHRSFLLLGASLGLVLVTLGHTGSVQGWGAGLFQDLLDGALAPLRNVHKFDPVVRLPLVLGLAWQLDVTLARLRAERASRSAAGSVRVLNNAVVVGTALLAVVGGALPALAGRLTPSGGFVGVPGYWHEAADWLDELPGTTLLVPGSAFGTYVWGSPRDEPMQWLAQSRWAVRNAVPLAPPGNIRMLDAVESRLAQGKPSAGLAAYLRRAGVGHLLVRNDLQRGGDVPDPVLVHQAIQGSPGLTRVATFGPDIGGQAHLRTSSGRVVINGGWQAEYPALEVYEVAGPAHTAVRSTEPPVVVGGPEDLLDLADLGVLEDAPAVLAADTTLDGDRPQTVVLTDGLRSTERFFGRVHDATSATLPTDAPLRFDKPARDYLLPDQDRWSTHARLAGVRAVTASSSVADAGGAVGPGNLPYAAFDGSADTAWLSKPALRGSAWWQVTLDRATEVPWVRVTVGADREVLRIRTSTGATRTVELAARSSRRVPLGGGPATWVRVEDASGRPAHQLALREVSLPEVTARRYLVTPRLPDGWGAPDTIVLRRVADARTGCAQVTGAVRCVADRSVSEEEPFGLRRLVRLPAAGRYVAELTVQPRPRQALYDDILGGQLVAARGSSVANADPRSSAVAAVDGDPGTTWTASLADPLPGIEVRWIRPRAVRAVRLVVAADAAARRPTRITVVSGDDRRRVVVDERGWARFRPIRTDHLTVRVRQSESVSSLDFESRPTPVPVGISELRIPGVPGLPARIGPDPVSLPCGSGPMVEVDRRLVSTAVTATPAQLFAGATVPARLCTAGPLLLGAGANRLTVAPSRAFLPMALVLRREGSRRPGPALPVAQQGTGSTLRLGPGPGRRGDQPGDDVVALRQNTNPGWRAEQDGQRLVPTVVDGWQQAWGLEETSAPLRVGFRPTDGYTGGLLGGLLSLVALAALALAPRRRWLDSRLPPLRTRVLSPTAAGMVAVLGAGLLAGWLGCLLGLAAFAGGQVLARRSTEVGGWAVAGFLAPAALAYALRPWGDPVGWAGELSWPHYLVVVALAGAVGWSTDRPLRRTLRSRIAGISTRR